MTHQLRFSNEPIERRLSAFRLGEEPREYEHWLTVSMAERLNALVNLINVQQGWIDEPPPRLERVLTATKLEPR